MPSRPISPTDLNYILQATSPYWNEMRGEEVFLTGGTGFFGCWLVESFLHCNRELQLGAHATVLSRNPANFAAKCPHLVNDPALTLVAGDVRNFDLPRGKFSYVIHAATEASARQATEQPVEMLTTIIDGTERVLELARACSTRKLLLTSSGAIYGSQPHDLTHVPEEYLGGPDPLSPASVYAEGKRISEQMCALQASASEIEIKIARCFAFVGPHLPLHAHFAIGNFIADVLAGRPILINGDGTPRRSYLYAADLTIWLWTILFRAPSLVPINVGSGHDLSIFELAQEVVTSLNASNSIQVAKEATPDAPISRYVPSIARAEQLLGLKVNVNLRDAIRRTAQWHMEGKA
jgi:dTDP-glucose 4,6-dehydratase